MVEDHLVEDRLAEIGGRIRDLREVLGISVEDMAEATGTAADEYRLYEEGRKDFSFSFLFNCAQRFGVDMEDLLTGESPRLSLYSLVRKGEGMTIARRHGFRYRNLAFLFKQRLAEPFLVEAGYDAARADEPLTMNTHEGQEFDYVLSGSLRMQIDRHVFTLQEGDAVYYDSSHPHGMTAETEAGCRFLAVVMGAGGGRPGGDRA